MATAAQVRVMAALQHAGSNPAKRRGHPAPRNHPCNERSIMGPVLRQDLPPSASIRDVDFTLARSSQRKPCQIRTGSLSGFGG
jgi:hypothetical protein